MGMCHTLQLIIALWPMQMQVVQVPNRGIWGTAGIDGANLDKGIANDGDYQRVGQRGLWGPSAATSFLAWPCWVLPLAAHQPRLCSALGNRSCRRDFL